jgi:hypothetical protein
MSIQNLALRRSIEQPGPTDYKINTKVNFNLRNAEKVSFTKQTRSIDLSRKMPEHDGPGAYHIPS